MRRHSLILLVSTLLVLPLSQAQQRAAIPWESTRAAAEKAFAEKSFAVAHRLYESAQNVPDDEKRWRAFRLADTAWRAEAASRSSDDTTVQRSRVELEALIAAVDVPHDALWAEVNESLADWHFTRAGASDFTTAWPYYEAALGFWAGSSELETARHRYLNIIDRVMFPYEANDPYYYSRAYIPLPLETARNAADIATTADEKVRYNILLAARLQSEALTPEIHEEIKKAFDRALAAGPHAARADEALFGYARWLEERGSLAEVGLDVFAAEPDFVRAIPLYERFLASYREGESSRWRWARQRLDEILQPRLDVTAGSAFHPNDRVTATLLSRNIEKASITLRRVSLVDDFAPKSVVEFDRLAQSLGRGGEIVSTSVHTIESGADHRPRTEEIELARKLPAGTYLAEVSSGTLKSAAIVFVTDIVVVTKIAPDSVVAWVTDAVSGAPRSGADVRLLSGTYRDNVVESTRRSDASGLVSFPRKRGADRIAIIARSGASEAISVDQWYGGGEPDGYWVIYALTDRPAYRPGETVQWKVTARRRKADDYITPTGETLHYVIRDARGSAVSEGDAKLNRFGSAWGAFDVTASMPLGVYTIELSDGSRPIASTSLFRLEEYKLPEFNVTVKPAEENGKPKIYRLGDTVEATVRAEYYFGGPVANAEVAVRVEEAPYAPYWAPHREYPWYFDGAANGYYGWNGNVVKEERVRTDANGEARIRFASPAAGENRRYTFTASVTDSSRREVTGVGSVRVTRQSHFVAADVPHYLYLPGEHARVTFNAKDANDAPVQVEGRVVVTRDEWMEVWVDDEGNVVRGREVERKRAEMGAAAFAERYTIQRSGYEHEKIRELTVRTDERGDAVVELPLPREGFYRFAWRSDDRRPGRRFASPVTAETTVWVARDATSFTGYRHDGIQILTDNDTARVGDTVPVLLITRDPGAHILFSVETGRIDSYRVVSTEGNARLVRLPIERRHAPNVFLTANTVRFGQLLGDTKQLIVPPLENFIDVTVTPDRGVARPRESGMLSITTRDWQDKPIAAEVTLAVRDASVFAIQQDFAADPRERFFGRKRYHAVRTGSSTTYRPFAVRSSLEKRKESSQLAFDAVQETGAMVGAVAAEAVSQTITVTASAPVMRDAGAVPPPPPAPAAPAAQAQANGVGANGTAVTIRNDFRTTILWKPDLATDESGTARVQVKYPDSTTTWDATATAFSSDTTVGAGSGTVKTRQPLIARLQLPRFLVVGDAVTVSGIMNNNTEGPLTVTPQLEADGVSLSVAQSNSLTVAPLSDARVDWNVRATKAGTARFRLTARGTESDGMELSIPVYPHGIDKLVAASGKLRGSRASLTMRLPGVDATSARASIQITSSIAATMLDALPYLIDYPYGCTEQTMSRFLPAAIVAQTLSARQVSAAEIERTLFGGIEPSTASSTHNGATRANIRRLDEVTRRSLERLYDFQHDDGGWGWWQEGESDAYMTAYVLWGLTLARDARIDVESDAIDRAARFLEKRIVESEQRPAEQAWLLHALAEHRAATRTAVADAQTRAFDNVYAQRERLTPYARALLLIAAHRMGKSEQVAVLVRNLENDVRTDDAPDASVVIREEGRRDDTLLGTAHWGEEYGWWRWYDGAIESTAMTLKALVLVDPKHRLVEPAMNWLVKNRRGAQWSNTRDTALAVLALNEYLKQSGELGGEAEFEVEVNGRSVARKSFAANDRLGAPMRIDLDPTLLREQNEIVIRRVTGTAPLYFAATAQYFTREEPVTPAGNEIFVRRRYFRVQSRPTLLNGFVDERVPLRDGETIRSGDRIEVEATVEVKNDYEYLMFDDLKPAGLEAVALQSGGGMFATKLKTTGVEKINGARDDERDGRDVADQRWIHQELRDRKVVTFADRLSQGIWRFHYTLRAEAPGEFHALPMIGQAMYVPELRGNSDEVRITVKDRNVGNAPGE